MSDLLSTILPEQAPVRVRAIDILRYRPGRRCVLKYDIQTASGLIEAIGKLYPQAEQATAVARKLALFGSSAIGDLSFPTLLSPPAGSSFLLMNRIPGENLGDLLERTTNVEQAAVLVRNAAVALHAFHSHRLDGPAARTVPAELAKLKQRVRGIHTVAPELAGWIDAVLQEVTVRVQHLASNDDTCAIHGEFKPNQLLVDGDRIAVVDLDRACNGDPALDVGNFMAVLRKEALVSGHVHLAEADAKFADEYIASGGRLSTLERARLAQIIATLRSLARSFEQYPGQYEVLGSAWPPLALLQDAQHLLASQ